MSLMSRSKGQRGEREAAKAIAGLFNIEASRGVQFCGGPDSPDIKHSVADVHFEVKRTEKLYLWPAIAQATEDADGKVPVVLHRANNKPWVVICPLDQLPRLATQIYLTMAANPK